jgi:HTH-type transcriptional regulator/antitoxin MqsA
MNTQELCPLCGEGHVSVHSEMVENEYKAQKAMLPLMFKLCDACGSDFACAAESKLNKRALMAWRKQVDGLLTGAEITALRKQYKLTQTQAAKLFGGGPVAFSKYENDDVAQSESMDTLLRLVRRSQQTFWALVEEKNLAAEFMVVSKTVKATTATVIPFNATRSAPGRADIHYDPRQFRKFDQGAVPCLQ